MSVHGFLDRVPPGVPTSGQFANRFRGETRLRLLPAPVGPDPQTRAAELGLDVEDYATFERLEAVLARAAFSDRKALGALERMTYQRITALVDEHAKASGDYTLMPTCVGCERAWGTDRKCRACTDLYGEPLPLRMRVDAALRAADTRPDRSPERQSGWVR